MKLVCHDPRSFLATAGPFLEQAEAEHILMLGVAKSLVDGSITMSAPPLLATIDDGEVRLAAVRTPPYNLLLSRGPSEAVQILCDALQQLGTGLPGVTGPTAGATEFAGRWTDHRELTMSQRIYRCDSVVAPTDPSGRVRTAVTADLEMLVAWVLAFSNEANVEASDADARRMIGELVERQRLFVWEQESNLASMALARQPTGHGIRLSYVYTPPDRRRRGFASAVTAGATAAMLERGYTFCCLYTDLANPTSNAIYQRIGYQPISESTMWSFLPEP